MNNKIKKPLVAFILPMTILLFCIWSAKTPWIGWCPESFFELAPKSRLPRWFIIPSGYQRKDLMVEIHCYAPPPPFKQNVKAFLLGPPPDYRVLDKKIGLRRTHPLTEIKKIDRSGIDEDAFPVVSIVAIDGIDEIIEQKRREPVLYVSDDPQLRETVATLK